MRKVIVVQSCQRTVEVEIEDDDGYVVAIEKANFDGVEAERMWETVMDAETMEELGSNG